MADAEPPAKRARGALQPEDLSVGLAVIFWGDKEGIVSDAFQPLNQFWVRARATGEVVRDEFGEIVAFGAEDLRLASAPGQGPSGQAPSTARVLLIGTELQMLKIIEHFGPPDVSDRREPQMLLAVPCAAAACGPHCGRFDPLARQSCDAASCPLLRLARQGIEPGMHELSRSLRPDLEGQIEVRAYHLKQALEQLGPDIARLQDFYCLSAVSLPFGVRDIERAGAGAARHTMEEVRCQIDLGATASGDSIDGEASLEITAQRVLGEACGVSISERIWQEDVQLRLRRASGVDLPCRYWDGPDTKGFVLLLPSDLTSSMERGLLTFKEPVARHGEQAARAGLIGGKTVTEWQREQDRLFPGQPKLPAGWIRVKSRSSDEVYYYHAQTQQSTFDFPLPEGWTKQVSKSSGKTYYFNAKRRQSSYTIPTE